MNTRQIPRDSWPSFLDSFTRQHYGWLVTVTRNGEHLADDQPLDFAQAEKDAVVISAGGHLSRIDAREIAVTAAGADDAAIGHVTISGPHESLTIRFRAVIAPQLVDGVV